MLWSVRTQAHVPLQANTCLSPAPCSAGTDRLLSALASQKDKQVTWSKHFAYETTKDQREVTSQSPVASDKVQTRV